MKKLYRSRKDSVISGLCGGLGEFLEIDSALIRIGLLLATIFGGLNILVYLISWIIVPEEPIEEIKGYQPTDDIDTSNPPNQADEK